MDGGDHFELPQDYPGTGTGSISSEFFRLTPLLISSVKLYRGDTAGTGTDIGGVGGQV